MADKETFPKRCADCGRYLKNADGTPIDHNLCRIAVALESISDSLVQLANLSERAEDREDQERSERRGY